MAKDLAVFRTGLKTEDTDFRTLAMALEQHTRTDLQNFLIDSSAFLTRCFDVVKHTIEIAVFFCGSE